MGKEERKKETIDSIKGKKFLIKPLRTYEDDVANLVKKNKVNTSSIVLAEQERKKKAKDEKKVKEVEAITVPNNIKKKRGLFSRKEKRGKHKNIVSDQRISKAPIDQDIPGAHITEDKSTRKKKSNWSPTKTKKLIAIILLLLGVGLISSALIFTELGNKIVSMASINDEEPEPEIIDNETDAVIVANNKTARTIKINIQENIANEKNLDFKEISEIKIVKNTISEEGGSSGTQKLSTTEFFRIISPMISGELVRSLDSNYILGVINVGETKPFLLFKTNDLDQTYAQMFDWESTLYRDVNDIFLTLGTEDFYKPEETELNFDPRVYSDEIMLNRDARAIIDENNNIVFFYSFVNSEYLLMATDIEVMREIIQKLNTQRLIR